MTKTFVLNIANLKSEADALKIEEYFMGLPGLEKVDIEMNLSLVSLCYNEAAGSPLTLLESLERLGYPVR